jgi:hypothetical protein
MLMSMYLPVAVLSYGWASKGHPDPTGEQLQSLVPALRSMVNWCNDGYALKWGIVMDFMSLPQRGYTVAYDPEKDDRTPYECARFGAGLKSINIWYGHPYVTTLVVDLPMPAGSENAAPVERRGWCIFERQLSSITKDSGCCLTLSGLQDEARQGWDADEAQWIALCGLCQGSRTAPLSPDAFEVMMVNGMAREAAEAGTGFRFTNGKDATRVCIPQYREAFVRLVGGAEGLMYANCDWKAGEVVQLCDALVWAHENGATTQAIELNLRGNELTDAAVARIVELVSSSAMPKLQNLHLDGDSLSEASRQSLQAACEARGAQPCF